jgi:hypothetical protein
MPGLYCCKCWSDSLPIFTPQFEIMWRHQNPLDFAFKSALQWNSFPVIYTLYTYFFPTFYLVFNHLVYCPFNGKVVFFVERHDYCTKLDLRIIFKEPVLHLFPSPPVWRVFCVHLCLIGLNHPFYWCTYMCRDVSTCLWYNLNLKSTAYA